MRKFTQRLTTMLLLLSVALGAAATSKHTRLESGNAKLTMQQMADDFAVKAKDARVIDASQLAAQRGLRRADDANSRWETLIKEDFSLFVHGTEDEPDGTMHPQEYFTDYSLNLPDSLFHTSGWNGLGVYEAGGNVALAYPNYGGVLNSPQMNMNGRIRIKLRAKVIKKKALFFVNIVGGSVTSPYDPIGTQMNLYDIAPEDGWQDIEVTMVNPDATNTCFLQINAANYNKGAVIVDSVVVERDANYIATPTGLSVSDFTYDGFKAQWGEAFGANGYLTSLYRKTPVSTENGVYANDLESVSIDHGKLNGLAEGWTAEVDTCEDVLLNDCDGYDGTHSLVLGSNGNSFTFDAGESGILNASMAVKLVDYDEEKASSTAALYLVFYKGKGRTIWYVPLKNLTKEWQVFDLASLLTEFTPGAYSKFEFYFDDLAPEVCTVAIDAIACETTPKTEIVCVESDKEVSGTSTEFTGLDFEANEYFFTVKGKAADGRISGESERGNAYGVAAPHVKAATDIDRRGAYTANWEAAPNATSYKLSNYEVYTVQEDYDSFDVFTEDFGKSSSNAGDSVRFMGNYQELSLDDYADHKGWTSTGTLIGNGETGCYMDDYGSMFDLCSPEITVGRNGGDYKVTVDFRVMTAGETLIVQGDQTMYQAITAESTGKQSATVDMTGGTDFTHLMFYTYNSTPFLIDRVVVSQKVSEGDKIYTLLSEQTVEDAATSARVSGLEPREGYDYAYNLVSYYDRYGTTYTSSRSDNQLVDFEGLNGMKPLRLATDGVSTECYDLQGRKVSGNAKGLVIVKMGGKVQKMLRK